MFIWLTEIHSSSHGIAPSTGGRGPLKKFEKVNVTQDLDQYLRNKHALIAPEFSEVVADATAFIEDVLRNGFEAACSRLGEHVNVQPDRPFIEVAEVLVEYHIRF